MEYNAPGYIGGYQTNGYGPSDMRGKGGMQQQEFEMAKPMPMMDHQGMPGGMQVQMSGGMPGGRMNVGMGINGGGVSVGMGMPGVMQDPPRQYPSKKQYPPQSLGYGPGYGPVPSRNQLGPQFPGQNLNTSIQSDHANLISDQPYVQGRPIGHHRHHQPRMKTGLDRLRHLPAVFVKQKFEMLEALTGCETENRYKVYASNENMDKVGDPIFKCKEKSSFLARNCLSGDCRPFQMKIIKEEEEEEDDRLFLWLDRPCKLTCYCFNRPEITVHLKENGQDKYLGKVVSEWSMCDMVFDIYDERDGLIYHINGDCCQWGLYCNCPCQPCAKIFFEIRTPDGEKVGEIAKIFSGLMQEMFTDTDNFGCTFPVRATPEHKALLIATILFIDFRYFEMNPQQSNQGMI